MGKKKQQKPKQTTTPKRNKKIDKNPKPQPVNNIISIKKLNNEKQIVAEFPLIRVGCNRQVMSIPVYRKDKLYFTPGFSLPDQFTAEFKNQQQLLHQYRVTSESNEVNAENIKKPKPSARNSYCTICKYRFEDYHQHTLQVQHVTKMNGSHFNKYITQICEKHRLERFWDPLCSREETSTEEIKYIVPKVFLEEQTQNIQKKSSGNSKQILYELIKQEAKIQCKPISTDGNPQQNYNQNDIWNVLA